MTPGRLGVRWSNSGGFPSRRTDSGIGSGAASWHVRGGFGSLGFVIVKVESWYNGICGIDWWTRLAGTSGLHWSHGRSWFSLGAGGVTGSES